MILLYMTEIEKYIKYKIKYENLKNDINFYPIESILNNLGSFYNIMKKQYEIHSSGGKNNNSNSDSDSHISNNKKKYYKKYKNLIKSSAKSINYYKNMIQLQMSNQMKINNYYSNLIGILRSQRDRLASGFQILGNDFKNEKEKINMLETMINGLEKYIQSSKTVEVNLKKIKLSGGGLNFEEFQNSVLLEMTGLSEHITSIDKDKKFLESKIENLHDRMKNIVVTNDILFKIKGEIEWMVNQLENVGDGEKGEKVIPQDFTELYEKIQGMIVKAKEEGKINNQMSEYVHKLEEYASYLENFIKSNNKTLGSIKLDKIPIMNKAIDSKKDIEEGSKQKLDYQIGGSNFKKIIGGGNFEEQYYKRSEDMINNLKKTIQIEFNNVELNDINNIIESFENKTEKNFPIYFGKIATMFGLIIKLDKMLEDLNKAYMYLSNNPEVIKFNEITNNLVENWKIIFGKKKTDFYEKLLTYKIYYENVLLTLENVLKKLEPKQLRIIIDSVDIITNIDTILENLDNTVICMDHIIFFIINLSLVLLKGQEESNPSNPEITSSIASLEEIIKEKKDNLTKSALLNSSSVYSILYGQSGGTIEISFPTEPLEALSIEQIPIYLELFVELTKSNLIQSSVDPLKATNETQIDKTVELTKTMNSLYDKVIIKLGVKDNLLSTISKEQKQMDSFDEFDEYVKNVIKSSGTHLDPQDETSSNVKSIITKPRLDIYKEKLIKCKNELQPYIKSLAILRNLLSTRKNAGKIKFKETLKLFSLYNTVKKQVEEGINSYIKLIPMIFFTIEFPPSIYAKDTCKYQFTFDSKNNKVEYKFIEGLNKEECNTIGLGNFEEKEFEIIKFNSHAGFFESNKTNTTNSLITDPIIGLGKLIKTDIDFFKPINCVINMMFALGASGTGKTTRYFGKSNSSNPDDREGIVPYIINKSLEDAKSKEISIAYFVCYGQKTQIDNNNSDFNELVVFFDINQIQLSNSNSNLKYIPFYMPKSATQEQDVNKYTQFYSTVISKKLERRTYTELEDFISKGGDFPKLSSKNDGKPFREILENTPEIWKIIKPTESDTIGELFENLIIEQKKINTILPTKNNIESSRGHTCVLVKIEDKSAEINQVKYFPLFDMAGTENTSQINDFLKKGRNTSKMAKLVQKVNTITQKADILRDDDDTKQYPSLNDLLGNESIAKYVQQAVSKKYMTINSIGGAKEKIPVSKFYDDLNIDQTQSPGENFLNKIIKEGYYINHTISMLIFTTMCVGYSLRTEYNSSTKEDNFDDFLDSVFTEVNKFTCIPSLQGDTECQNKTMMLLKAKNTGAIVNSSCIWLQILFSFLYWNEETPESIKYMLNNLNKQTKTSLDYLCEPNVKKAEFIPKLLTVEQLLKVKTVTDESLVHKEIFELMKKVNISEEFNSKKILAGPVSIVSIEGGKIKIERTLLGQGKVEETTKKIEVTIVNDRYQDWLKAKEAREKMGLTSKSLENSYYKPTLPKERQSGYDSLLNKITDEILRNEYNSNSSIATATPVNEKIKIVIDVNYNQLTDELKEKLFDCQTKIQEIFDLDNKKFKRAEFNNEIKLGIWIGKEKNKYYNQNSFHPKMEAISNFFKQNSLVKKIMHDDKEKNYQVIKKDFTYDLLKDLQQDINIIIDNIPGGKSIKIPEGITPIKPELIIIELDKVFTLPHTLKLLQITGTKLKMNSSDNPFTIVNGDEEIGSLKEIMTRLENLPSLPTCPNLSENNKLITENQIHRIKDGRTAATKMTLMHLVTGQGLKHYMVNETIKLCETLFQSTNLDLTK